MTQGESQGRSIITRTKVALGGVRDSLKDRSSQSLLSAIILAVIVAAVGMVAVTAVLDWYVERDAPTLATQRATLTLDVLKVAGAVVAGLGAAVALTVSYRRQREEEGRRDGERFEQAARQLGDADPAVRIAGAYALGRLGDESDEYRRPCVQLLCAYLRLNRPSDVTVQQTICEVLTARLGRQRGVPGLWSNLPLDLHGVVFHEEVNFAVSTFAERTRFDRCVFKGDALFINTTFGDQTIFNGATFEGSALFFSAGFFGTALFNDTTFHSTSAFSEAVFARGLQANGAKFQQGAYFSGASFPNGAIFSGAELGTATFYGCSFARGTGRDQSDAVFNGIASFRRATFKTANFDETTFSAGADFDEVRCEAHSFRGASFTDVVSAKNADFGPAGLPTELGLDDVRGLSD